MKRFVILFLILLGFSTFSKSQTKNDTFSSLCDSIKKLDYSNVNDDKLLIYAKALLNNEYDNKNSILHQITNKSTISELIIMAESAYMCYDFDRCYEILEKLESLEKRHKKIPYITYLKNRLNKATMLINTTDFFEVISSQIYDIDQINKGIELPTDNGSIKITFSIDSLSKQIKPESIYISSENVKRIVKMVDSIGNHKLECQIYVGDKWVESGVSTEEIPSDICFPYVFNDGITLYFSNKDENGLGGYDLFMSRFDTDKSKFFAPSLIGMPYNSPENDYLMMYNQKENITYLITDRMLDNGHLSVIKLQCLNKDSIPKDSDKVKLFALLSDYKKYSNNEHDTKTVSDEGKYYFRINKDITIRRLSDFKSSDARNCFKQSLDCMGKIRESEELLNEKIKIYRDTKDLETKKYIGAELEDYRNKIRVLRQEYNSLLVESKNYEIEYNKK